MTVFERIKTLLREEKIDYRLLEHPPVHTCEEAAKIRGTKLSEGAKALVLAAEEKPILVVVPCNRQVDFKAFKKSFNVKNLRLLKPAEVKTITGLEIGSIPPLGNVLNLPTFFDRRLTENTGVVFNAGEHTRSIIMEYKDLERVVKPTLGGFSK